MTEDDAKTKWCPMAREGAIAEAAFPMTRAAGYCCIGSACVWGCDDDGKWRGHCGLTPPPSIDGAPATVGQTVPTAIMRGKMGDPIGNGVYNNPQPGDADFPGESKTDIGSGG